MNVIRCPAPAICRLLLITTALFLGSRTGQRAAADEPAATLGNDRLTPAEVFRALGEADKAFRAFDYQRARALYEQITTQNPYHGEYWIRLARCQQQTGQLEQAVASFQRGLSLGDDSPPGQTQYQIALLFARLNDAQQSIDWLERALAARHEHRAALRTDKRFDALRGDDRFARLIAEPVNADTLSRPEQWNRDLDHLLAEAARMHVLWNEGDRAERFTGAVNSLRGRIDELTEAQILVEIQKVMVQLGDGHSLVRAGGRIAATPRLPLRLYYFSDGLYVIDAAEPYRELIGCRIDQIGSATAAEAEQRLATIISHDNAMGVKANGTFSLVNPLRLQALGMIDDPSSVSLAVTDRAGQSRTVRIEPGKPLAQTDRLIASQLPAGPAAPLSLRRTDENLWFEPLAEIDGVYLQFNDVGNQPGRQIADIAAKLREYLATHPTRALIVDLRHNGGGNTYLSAALLKTLIYYEVTQPAGRMYAIIGRGTFSAAQNFTNDVDRLTDATFIGEPTASRPSFAGESTQAVLPYSGVTVSISTRLHQHAYATDRRVWVAPDVPAELSSADYFAGRDPALEAILAIEKSSAGQAAKAGTE